MYLNNSLIKILGRIFVNISPGFAENGSHSPGFQPNRGGNLNDDSGFYNYREIAEKSAQSAAHAPHRSGRFDGGKTYRRMQDLPVWAGHIPDIFLPRSAFSGHGSRSAKDQQAGYHFRL
ncbi:MAG: hypothetical protein R3D63_04515 [Paracoccaceae bacterium]